MVATMAWPAAPHAATCSDRLDSESATTPQSSSTDGVLCRISCQILKGRQWQRKGNIVWEAECHQKGSGR